MESSELVLPDPPQVAGSGGGLSSPSQVEEVSSLMQSMHLPQFEIGASTPPPPSQSPFVTRHTALKIDGVHTEIVTQAFADRIFITLTQINKIGTLIFAKAEESSPGVKQYDTQILLGRRDDPLLVLYARQLIEQISKTADLPLLLAISLAEEGRGSATFQTAINTVMKLKCW
mmetsp:Transcript_8840/g.19968  ORF Transcript_8840/g.19968 Transcript_8840/m.19968 type:complete len:173 (-) Transcript_8840:313-831(-)